MSPVLLDTDIVSYFLRGHSAVEKHISAYLDEYSKLQFSIFTQYEIISGLRYRDARNHLQRFRKFMVFNRVIPLTEQSVEIATEVYATLRSEGHTIDDIDILIASIALEHDWHLVTNNTKHFAPIPNLIVENWTHAEL
jgi:tRNA(fMet)-specific endonuclease VapC